MTKKVIATLLNGEPGDIMIPFDGDYVWINSNVYKKILDEAEDVFNKTKIKLLGDYFDEKNKN